MKTKYLVVYMLPACCIFGGPAVFVLKDGRVLSDPILVSETGSRVIFRVSGGLVGVNKRDLPSPLAQQYPVNEEQAKAKEEALKRSVAGGPTKESNTRSRPAGKQTITDKKTGLDKERAPAAVLSISQIRSQAARMVQEHFASSQSGVCAVDITKFTQVCETPVTWELAGVVRISELVHYDKGSMETASGEREIESTRIPDTGIRRPQEMIPYSREERFEFSAMFYEPGEQAYISVNKK